MASEDLPSVENIHRNHDLIVEEYHLDNESIDDPFPDRKLQDIIDEASEYDNPYLRAATLLREIAAVHIYADGNKRTAWITTVEYLDRLGTEPTEVAAKKVNRVTRALSRFQVEEIAEWLKTGEIDESRLN